MAATFGSSSCISGSGSVERKPRMCLMPACRGQRRDLVHKFPMNNARAELWRQLINDPQLTLEPLDSIRKKRFICNRHFRQQDYKNVESRSLNSTAVPSLLLGSSTNADIGPNRSAECKISDSSQRHSMMRLEINFDTVEVLNASEFQLTGDDCSVSSAGRTTPVEYVGKSTRTVEDLIDDRDLHPSIVSILERSPNQPNTYRLSTISTNHNSSTHEGIVTKENIDKSTKPSTKLILPEIDNRDESSEMLLIPLSSESFMNLQKSLLQQQSLAHEHPELQTEELVLDDILMDCKVECNNGAPSPDFCESESQLSTPCDDDIASMSPTVCCSCTTDATGTTIVHPAWSGPLQIAHFWLRDHCRCTDCYNAETAQRLQNVLDIPIGIRPHRVDANSDHDVLHVQWPDQHKSVYDLATLRTHFGVRCSAKQNGRVAALPPIAGTLERSLWTAESIVRAPYARVTLNDLLCNDDVARAIVASLVSYGVAFIEKVPANIQSTEVAVKRMFAVHKTLFGEMWSLTDNAEHADTAYSKDGLGAHTDNTYFNDAAGLQVLHCVQHSGSGGESLLLDGFNAVRSVRERNPAAYERLCRRNVPAEYVERGQHHTYAAPMVRLRPDSKEVEQIRFNLYDRARMPAMPPDQMLEFYKDLRLLSAEIQSPANEWWFKLRPGTVLIFDNWRLLHGRSAYTGRRQLCGCYVSRTEFESVARTMGLIK